MRFQTAAMLGALIAATACGGSDGSGNVGERPDPQGPGGTPPDAKCDLDAFTTVVEERSFGSPLVHMEVDADRVYFSAIDSVWAADRAGGTPLQIYPSSDVRSALYPPFWLSGDEVIVGARDELHVLMKPHPGVLHATHHLPAAYDFGIDGSADILFAPESLTFYGKYDGTNVSADGLSLDYWSYEYASKNGKTLAGGTTIGKKKRLVLAGSHLYVASRIGDVTDPNDTTADELWRIPRSGGAPERIAMSQSLRFDLVGADDTHLYLVGWPYPGSLADGGVYRLPRSGGAAEKVIDRPYASARLAVRFVNRPERMLLWILGDLWSIPHGSGKATLITSTGCNIHSIAMDGDEIFLGVSSETDSARARVVRFTLD